ESSRAALILPIRGLGDLRPIGFLVAGLSPRLVIDDDYRSFFGLIAGHLAAAVGNARAYEEEKRRAEALAEIDRAKTAFFSNVSHEFRTPLTLMMGPLEDAISDSGTPLRIRDQLEIAHRNSLRLLKMVNSMLDFARIEAGRVQASYEPTDLSALTADISSVFRSAVERAGMTLAVACEPLEEAAYVDRDMWEKIVLNLLSNAFKYTFVGGITVRLRQLGADAELAVEDTGVGIPESELPLLFQRFHRVEGARGRTHEGTGIGLALVQELLKLHGGSISAESNLGRGSRFIARLPLGSRHLPPDRVRAERTLSSTAIDAGAYVEEALRWLPDLLGRHQQTIAEVPDEPYTRSSHLAVTSGSRIILAEDNSDMRGYLLHLLKPHWNVEAVADGQEAFHAALREKPDLILSDVMMPGMDGFELVAKLRAHNSLNKTPIILLSARAGEEARVEGLEAGADDYLIKPFSGRELLARVGAALALSRVRREAARSLIASEERFRAFVSASSDVVFRVGPDWRELKYLQGQEFIPDTSQPTQSWLEKYIHPDHQKYVLEAINKAIRTKSVLELEHPVLKVDGTLGWTLSRAIPILDAEGEIEEWFGTARDITERKHTEEALAEAGQRLELSVGAADLGTFYCPMPLGRLIWNAKCKEHFFLPPDAEVDIDLFYSILHPDDRDRVRQAVDRALGTDEPYDVEYRAVAPDGRVRWIRAKGRAYKDAAGNTTRFDGITIDITDLKKAEEDRARLFEAERTARASAERSGQLKDEFLATLSHELRTPLNAILGWAQVLRQQDIGGDVGEGLAIIERNSRAQAQLIEDLLDMSRIISGKLRIDVRQVNLSNVISAAVQSVQPAADAKAIRLQIVLDHYAGLVRGDPARLQQVIWNLLTNAIKFTPRDGNVVVSLERVNSHIAVSVVDNGAGIEADFLPYVFERFRQADGARTRKHGGLGLGLAIVKGIVEAHGGRVRAASDGLGKGAAFIVELPLMAMSDFYETNRERRVHPRGALLGGEPDGPICDNDILSGAAVLIVEDDGDNRDLTQRVLEEHGARVILASSAAEAFSLVQLERPDVILSDIGMPGEDGYEFIRRVRALPAELGANTPAAALTAFARSEDRRRALVAGFQTHVAKPVEVSELVIIVASLAGKMKTHA
ncbi:MAG TPA: ATP-binding protein, partial [Blastocatellia bacterium]|nr:ATP-binding protein [Blastocatellia bacterium]